MDIKIITANEARHKEWIIENGDGGAPIGILDDVEVVFVHYRDKELARSKWMRRVERVNWNNLIFKFSQQNHATKEMLREFDEAELPGKKFMYVNEKGKYRCGVYYPGFDDDDQIYNDTYFGNRYWDVTYFINTGEIRGKQ